MSSKLGCYIVIHSINQSNFKLEVSYRIPLNINQLGFSFSKSHNECTNCESESIRFFFLCVCSKNRYFYYDVLKRCCIYTLSIWICYVLYDLYCIILCFLTTFECGTTKYKPMVISSMKTCKNISVV